MKYFILSAVTVILCAFSPVAEAKEAPIEAVISSQIDAFKADDFDAAFAYARPMIQRIFGSSENFGAMVRRGFPMVWRPADVRFLGLEARAGAHWQDVMIRDQQGRLHILEYEMMMGDTGWKINGVRIRTATTGAV